MPQKINEKFDEQAEMRKIESQDSTPVKENKSESEATAPIATKKSVKDKIEHKNKVIKGYSQSQIELITRTVARNATLDELQMFLHIAKKVKLDPFLKQIYFYKDNRGNCVIMTSRDGFLSIAQMSGEFAGLQSASVYENDEFSIDYSKNEVKHIAKQNERGELVGAWAKSYRKNSEPNITYVKFDTYNRGWNVWKTHPDAMIVKCAESISLKKTFGISGIVSQEEMGFDEKEQEKMADGKKLFEDTKSLIQKVNSEKTRNEAIDRVVATNQFSEEQNNELLNLKTNVK